MACLEGHAYGHAVLPAVKRVVLAAPLVRQFPAEPRQVMRAHGACRALIGRKAASPGTPATQTTSSTGLWITPKDSRGQPYTRGPNPISATTPMGATSDVGG